MAIKNLETIPATGELDNQFVGIKISDGKIEFHHPETYVLSKDDRELRRQVLAVLKTVSLAKTKTHDRSTYNTEHKSENVFPLSAYLWILNDYLVYGRYENREKDYLHGVKGKINWKKTLASNPVISEGNIIYTDIVSEQKNQKDNLLTEIYNLCVRESVDSIGWLYGVAFDSNGVDYYRLFEGKEKLCINAINTELSHTFDDQKKIRLNNMKNVILGLDDKLLSARDFVYGVDSYDYVYERMVDAMFSKVENIRDFYPSATWDLVIEKSPIKSSNLRPDTVIVKDKKVYILDAKYYRYGTTFKHNDIPETTSIQKQITYGEYVKTMKESEYTAVYSAFVMPYSKTTNIHKDRFNKDLEFVGIAKAKWLESSGETHRSIVGLLVDTNFLIDNWFKKSDDNIDVISAMIEKNIGGIACE